MELGDRGCRGICSAGRFVALDTKNGCVALFNRGVYGSHYENSSLYMSLARGVTYCAHPIGERELIPSDRFTKKIDQGENNYSFRLTVTERDKLERKAAEFNQKPYALNIFPVPCEASQVESLQAFVGGDIVAMPTVKKAYGGDEIIFRLLNNTGKECQSYIQVNEAKLDLSFGKYEVKTVVYKDKELTEHYELLV